METNWIGQLEVNVIKTELLEIYHIVMDVIVKTDCTL